MNELLSWGLVVAVVIGLVALAFNALQVISSGDEFWIAKGWFVIAALVAIVRFVYWGITTPRSLTLRLIVCIITCGLIAAVAVEAVRFVNRKRNLWMKSRPTINEASKDENDESEPPLTCVNTRTAEVGFNRRYWTENTSQKNVRFALVAFGNKDPKASMQNYVTARITFYDSSGNHLKHINNGVWLEEEKTSIQFFDVGEVRELAVAMMPLDVQEVYAFDSENVYSGMPTDNELRVEVVLRGGIVSVMLGTFNFKLTLQPEFAIEEIPPPQEQTA